MNRITRKINGITRNLVPCLSVFSVLFCFLLCVSVGQARAQTSRTLTVVPPTQDFKAKPGKQISANVKVRNETDEPITVKANTKDFLVFDDKGTPTMVEEEVSGRWSLSSWVIVSPTEYTIAARSSKVFDMVIIVPQDALPGGHYASVYFTPIESGLAKGISGAGIETKLASLIKVIIEGPIKEMAYVRKFWAPKFSEYGPITLTTQIENQSYLDITPRGSIMVKDLFGREVASYLIEEKRIFPYAVRAFTNTVDQRWLFGRYRATLNAAYGSTGQALIAYLTFWVIPWRIILAVILGIAIFALTFYWLGKRKIKKEEEIPLE